MRLLSKLVRKDGGGIFQDANNFENEQSGSWSAGGKGVSQCLVCFPEGKRNIQHITNSVTFNCSITS